MDNLKLNNIQYFIQALKEVGYKERMICKKIGIEKEELEAVMRNRKMRIDRLAFTKLVCLWCREVNIKQFQ